MRTTACAVVRCVVVVVFIVIAILCRLLYGTCNAWCALRATQADAEPQPEWRPGRVVASFTPRLLVSSSRPPVG